MTKSRDPAYSERLERLIREANATRRKVAEWVGVKSETVTQWITRGSVPNEPAMRRLCLLLETSPEYLLEGRGPRHVPRPRSSFDGLPDDIQADLATIGEACIADDNARRVIASLAKLFRSP